MSEYIRTTRECSVNELQPELRQAFQKHFQERGLGDPQTETVRCCETLSRRKNPEQAASWLDGGADTVIHTAILLTSEQLIWVHHGDRSGTRLNAAKLALIRAEFHTSWLMKDAGLEIFGYINDDNARVRGYIGMSDDPTAQKFCEEVEQAIEKINPSPKKGSFKWFMR